MSFGWEGDKVRLVPIDRAKHLDNAIQWLNDPEVTQWLLIGDFPLSRLAEEQWFDLCGSSSPFESTEVAHAIETLDGEHIGFSGLHKISFRHGTATSGIFIGAKRFWRQGFGCDAVIIRKRYAFEILGLRLLLSSCMDGNEASFKTLLKAGYKECGRVPKRYWKRGQYRDEILMYAGR